MKYLNLLVILTILVACKSKQEKTVVADTMLPSISLDQALGHITDESIKLSTIGSEFEYVKLETSSKCLLGSGKFATIFTITPKYIYSDRKKFLRKDGTFEMDMGHIGRGPGEYIRSFSVDIDTLTYNYFVLTNSYDLLTYSDNNELISQIRIEDASKTSIKYLYNGKMALHREACYGGDPYSGMQIIEMSEGISHAEFGCQEFEDKQSTIGKSGNFYNGIGGICTWENKAINYYYDPICDTIYELSTNGVKPFAIMNRGNYKPSYEIMLDNKRFEANQENYMMINGISQIGSNLHIQLSMGTGRNGRHFAVIYNLSNKRMDTIQLPNRIFNNDINILEVYTLQKVPNENRYFFYINSIDIITKILPKLEEMDYTKMSTENKKLYNVIKNQKLEDNPILCFLQ